MATKQQSLEELEKEQHRLMADRASIKAELVSIQAKIDVLKATERTKAILEKASDSERLALEQVIKANGIASGEKVGKVGSKKGGQ